MKSLYLYKIIGTKCLAVLLEYAFEIEQMAEMNTDLGRLFDSSTRLIYGVLEAPKVNFVLLWLI